MSKTATLGDVRNSDPGVLPIALTLAGLAHLAIAVLAPGRALDRTLPKPPLLVELALPNTEPAAPARPETAEPAPRAARAEHPARAAQAVRAPAPAGKLLAAEPSGTDAEAPLDFVTDPNGATYGFGVVSKGGAGRGEGTGGKDTVKAAATTAVAAPAASALAAPADLGEKPHLLVEDPCRGFYPANAGADAAFAVVRVVLEATGRVRGVTLLEEAPSGQGFGVAARQCIRQQQFSPARDREGRAVATATTIRVRFER